MNVSQHNRLNNAAGRDPIPFKEIQRVIQKQNKKRDINEQQLLNQFMGSIPFFYKYIQNGYRNIPSECAKVLHPLSIKKGEILFHINSEGNRFYIIIQGSVGLYTKVVDDTNPEDSEYSHSQSQHGLRLVKTLSAGDSFGELGLLSYKVRSATVECLQDCELAYIEKPDFDGILKQLEQELLEAKINAFAEENPVFKFSTKHTIKTMYFNAIFKPFNPNDFIFKAGDPIQDVYLIKSGSFQVQKQFKVKEPQENGNEDEGESSQKYSELKQTKALRSEYDENDITTLKVKQEKKRIFPLFDLGKSEMVGYEDFIQKNATYSYSIQCKALGEVIVIRGIHFKKWLLSDKHTVEFLESLMKKQSKYFVEREQEVAQCLKELKSFYFENKQPLKPPPTPIIIPNFIDKRLFTAKRSIATPEVASPVFPFKNSQQAGDELKSKKPSHYTDALSKDFQANLERNFLEKFGTSNLDNLKKHVSQDLVQAIDSKIKFKKIQEIKRTSANDRNQKIIDFIKHQMNSPTTTKTTTPQQFSTKLKPHLLIQQAKIAKRPQSSSSSCFVSQGAIRPTSSQTTPAQAFIQPSSSQQKIGSFHSFENIILRPKLQEYQAKQHQSLHSNYIDSVNNSKLTTANQLSQFEIKFNETDDQVSNQTTVQFQFPSEKELNEVNQKEPTQTITSQNHQFYLSTPKTPQKSILGQPKHRTQLSVMLSPSETSGETENKNNQQQFRKSNSQPTTSRSILIIQHKDQGNGIPNSPESLNSSDLNSTIKSPVGLQKRNGNRVYFESSLKSIRKIDSNKQILVHQDSDLTRLNSTNLPESTTAILMAEQTPFSNKRISLHDTGSYLITSCSPPIISINNSTYVSPNHHARRVSITKMVPNSPSTSQSINFNELSHNLNHNQFDKLVNYSPNGPSVFQRSIGSKLSLKEKQAPYKFELNYEFKQLAQSFNDISRLNSLIKPSAAVAAATTGVATHFPRKNNFLSTSQSKK